MTTRWQRSDGLRGDDYDARWQEMAAAGQDIHGEAELVESLLGAGRRVLDAGCGTGRVAIELARRGIDVVGIDADESMLATARAKAPELHWERGDLADSVLGGPFDLTVLAGNVMIFLEPGSEGRVLANLAAALRPGGLLVAGFSVRPDWLSLNRYDELADEVGLDPVRRWATWDRAPFTDGDYAVSVHRRRRGSRRERTRLRPPQVAGTDLSDRGTSPD